MCDKFLIIGSNSFSGASFISWLLNKDSEIEVVGISRSNEPHDAFLPYKSIYNYKDRFSFYKVDINNNVDYVIDIINSFKPSYIVNFAAQGMVEQSWDNPTQWIETNVLSLTSLLHGIHKFDFIDCFVQASTPEVYGMNNNLSESQCFNPSTPYAASKASADLLLNAYSKTHNFPVRYTRAANIYGASQQLYRIIPKTILKILKNEKLELHGGGKSIRSFIHIDDVASATYSIIKNGCNGEIYHISGRQLISIRELVAMICDLMGVNINNFVYNVDSRGGLDSKYYLNSSKINAEIGWSPNIDLSSGIKSTIHWAKDNYRFLENMQMEYIHKE